MLHSSHSKSCGRHSDSWHIFLKMSLSFPCLCQVALSLLVVSILSSMSSQAAFKIGMENRHTSLKYRNTSSMNTTDCEEFPMQTTGTALVFTGFKAYEKWEDTIDSMVGDACSILTHIGSNKKSSSQEQM